VSFQLQRLITQQLGASMPSVPARCAAETSGGSEDGVGGELFDVLMTGDAAEQLH